MTTVVAVGRRVLPRGYLDFARQLSIWLGFYFGYLAVRGIVDRNPTRALLNGIDMIGFEQRTFHHLFEQTAQQIADSSRVLLTLAAWTYWIQGWTGHATIAVAGAGYAETLLGLGSTRLTTFALAGAVLWLPALKNLVGLGHGGRRRGHQPRA